MLLSHIAQQQIANRPAVLNPTDRLQHTYSKIANICSTNINHLLPDDSFPTCFRMTLNGTDEY